MSSLSNVWTKYNASYQVIYIKEEFLTLGEHVHLCINFIRKSAVWEQNIKKLSVVMRIILNQFSSE